MESTSDPDLDKFSETLDTIEPSTYYSVYVPSDAQTDLDPYRHIFKEKHEALCLAKTYKKARFKSFFYYHEAVDFAMSGQTHTEPTQHDTAVSHHKESTLYEKPVAFRGPKSQDLVKLRKAIECSALSVVETTIWDNPRYLISSGDTPSILQEGSRYNALHVAAKCKNRNMCELLLNTVSNINFVTLLYGDDDNQDLYERSKILLDLYLNTPDKGLNETPLHFAVKFGAVDVVELLVSYPQCDKNIRNKFGKLPNQIICERCDSVNLKTKDKIAMLLEEAFYVPVLRSEYNCTPPVVGTPFAPSSPPTFNEDPLQPQIEIHAYAGPMSKEAAEKFRKVWRTPPRSLRQQVHCKDLEKGLERVGRNLAAKHEVGWKEYWSFLDDFADLTTNEGLEQLERYLASKVILQYSDDSCTNTNSSLGSSNVLSPISDLCKDLEACRLSENGQGIRNHNIGRARIGDHSGNYNVVQFPLLDSDLNPTLCIEKTCEVFAHRISNDILNLLESNYNKATYELLEVNITQLENVIASFMIDCRFNKVDYRFVHHRVAHNVVSRLKEFLIVEDEVNFMRRSLELWLEMCGKEFDYFSSDDECGNYRNHNSRKQHTPKNKQVICLLQNILSTLIIDNCTSTTSVDKTVPIWIDGKPCDCIWSKPTSGKKSGNKLLNRNFGSNQEDCVSRRLFLNDSDVASTNSENDCDVINKRRRLSIQASESGDSDKESFVTACDSENSDSEDMFEDSIMPEEDIFIEGSIPTKMDYAVYNAITYAKEKLNPDDYPNIYKWYHAVSQYSENERQSWGCSTIARCRINTQAFTTSTPTHSRVKNAMILHSPSSPWLRRLGLATSPQHSLKVFKPSVSFNL